MFSRFDRLVYRITARRWNKLIAVVLTEEAARGRHGPRLSDDQLYPLLAQFDPTQRPAWRRVVAGMAGLLSPDRKP